jgi:DNA-binding NarL/FixJ family response regulator
MKRPAMTTRVIKSRRPRATRDETARQRFLEPTNPGEDILTPEQWAEVADRLRLTPRELEVTVLTIEGRTRPAIARRLKLKTGTVRHHLRHLYRKLGVRDRLGLACRILRTRDLCSNVQRPQEQM